MVETRCTSGGIDHIFVNWLVHGNKLSALLRIRTFPQGEGAVNTLGGLRPDTVVANITGDLRRFWKVLSADGRVLNWNGEASPVVHQLDHFQQELIGIADEVVRSDRTVPYTRGGDRSKEAAVDRAWQAIGASRCLFDCASSVDFTKLPS